MPRIEKQLAERLEANSPIVRTKRVMMGKMDGTLQVAGEPLMIWVTAKVEGAFKVINRRLPNRWGKWVNIGYDPNDLPTRLQVLGLADQYIDANWDGPLVPDHRETHGYGATDCDWILRERVLYVAPVPGTNKIDIYPDAKQLQSGAWWYIKTALRVDYSAAIPASGALVCIVVVTAAGTIALRTGSAAATLTAITAAHFPSLTAGDSAIVGLKLLAGMTEATHAPGQDTLIPMDASGAYAGTTSGITSLTTDVVATGPGAAVATIQPGAVTNAKLADMTGPTVKGKSAGTGAPEDLTMTQLLAMGAGVFGGAAELTNEAADGSRTHFTFADAALAIWVMIDGVKQADADITFTSGTAAFDIATAPLAGATVEVIRLVATVAPPAIANGYILVRDEKAAGTAGGDFTAGAWRTRTLNTEVNDPGGFCTLAANQVTLAAGTYTCKITAPAYYVAQHQARLYNISDSATQLVGSSEVAEKSSANGTMTRSVIAGQFTIAAPKTFEVQHQAGSSFVAGFGNAANFGEKEVYTIAEFWKVA